MSTLSESAKKYIQAALETMPRQELVDKLEGIGCACYDEEDQETLAAAVLDSIEAEDIDFDISYVASKSFPHDVSMMWLDVDDFWI